MGLLRQEPVAAGYCQCFGSTAALPSLAADGDDVLEVNPVCTRKNKKDKQNNRLVNGVIVIS